MYSEYTAESVAHSLDCMHGSKCIFDYNGCILMAAMLSQIADYKRRLSDMQSEFADMLKETLDRMHDRLENIHEDLGGSE